MPLCSTIIELSIGRRDHQLPADILRLPLLAAGHLIQEVGEEEELQEHKDDEEFQQNQYPECPAPGHVAKTLQVKSAYAQACILHR